MRNSAQEQQTLPSSGARKKPVEPQFAKLSKPPEKLDDLFRCVAMTAPASPIKQPDTAGKKSPKMQHYALPWVGFRSWKDARERLAVFERGHQEAERAGETADDRIDPVACILQFRQCVEHRKTRTCGRLVPK